MGMDPIRQTLLLGEVAGETAHQIIQMGPEQFLAQIAARTKRQTPDQGPRADHFGGLGVIRCNSLVVDLTRDHLHPIHRLMGRQNPRQFEHIGGLPTRIRITPEL